ncbi:MAG: family 1 glycosylhydrolase, partial [Paracoccaceae bacterium]|nr:family 1 glycosylhydrolase [Paracoccaceae bacterium]
NGMAWDDKVTDKRVNDTVRIDFIRAHLDATLKAIAGGVNVGGFFYWSLLDNFEWAEGYAKRFGLIHVDFETQKRTPKASFEMLRNLMKRDD